MGTVERRIERLEQLVSAADCICGDRSAAEAVEIVVVEDGWDEERIRAAEDANRIVCPVHGLQARPILRLQGHDIDG